MITLYAFGPMWGMPDPSPFVIKTLVQLKMAGLPFRIDYEGYPRAPKGKLPFIEDDGVTVADSTFIRAHIEARYGVDLDAGLDNRQRATAWAVERLLEDHLTWGLAYTRWAIRENFDKGPAAFFSGAPEAAGRQARAETVAALRSHGLGRHSDAEIAELAARSFGAVSTLLGDQPYLFGDEPVGVDATAYGVIASCLCARFDGGVRDAGAAYPNLAAYCERMTERFFPELAAAQAA